MSNDSKLIDKVLAMELAIFNLAKIMKKRNPDDSEAIDKVLSALRVENAVIEEVKVPDKMESMDLKIIDLKTLILFVSRFAASHTDLSGLPEYETSGGRCGFYKKVVHQFNKIAAPLYGKVFYVYHDNYKLTYVVKEHRLEIKHKEEEEVFWGDLPTYIQHCFVVQFASSIANYLSSEDRILIEKNLNLLVK